MQCIKLRCLYVFVDVFEAYCWNVRDLVAGRALDCVSNRDPYPGEAPQLREDLMALGFCTVPFCGAKMRLHAAYFRQSRARRSRGHREVTAIIPREQAAGTPSPSQHRLSRPQSYLDAVCLPRDEATFVTKLMKSGEKRGRGARSRLVAGRLRPISPCGQSFQHRRGTASCRRPRLARHKGRTTADTKYRDLSRATIA